jgi:hypothetical protein
MIKPDNINLEEWGTLQDGDFQLLGEVEASYLQDSEVFVWTLFVGPSTYPNSLSNTRTKFCEQGRLSSLYAEHDEVLLTYPIYLPANGYTCPRPITIAYDIYLAHKLGGSFR